ncbi:hypothetical protein [Vallitalea okinawensis]|uniref:hypothetical protein n=1 Tax=Vallitalea okinawensis TaxID=2078660 RepID=UPI0014784FFA|nr:hypothetical protein [Vallitalea okinawensis]
MKKREIFMLSTLTFFMGIVFGFLISPAKNGIGNNAGNNITYHGKQDSTIEEAE